MFNHMAKRSHEGTPESSSDKPVAAEIRKTRRVETGRAKTLQRISALVCKKKRKPASFPSINCLAKLDNATYMRLMLMVELLPAEPPPPPPPPYVWTRTLTKQQLKWWSEQCKSSTL